MQLGLHIIHTRLQASRRLARRAATLARTGWVSRRGAAAVELALILPFLVLLLMGVFDFGTVTYTLMQVTAAAHAGALYAFANPTTCTSTAIASAEQSATSLGSGVTTTPPGSGVSVVTAAAPTCSFSGCVSGTGFVSSTSTCAAGDAPGTYAVAYAKASFSPLLPWAAFSLPTSISATAVMRYK
jgi:Flp pilus assembly protein TadG